MKKYGSYFIILICALLLVACAPEPERIEVFTEVEVTRIVELPQEIIYIDVVETVEIPIEVFVTPTVNFPTPVPTDQWPLTRFGDGVWMIGTEIERGIYKNIGPVGIEADGSSLCRWQIRKCFGGWRCVRDYDQNEFRYIVKILYGDVIFNSVRCGEWIKVSD